MFSSRESLLRSREIFTQVQTLNCTGRLRTACTKRFLVPQHLDICESNPWTNKIVDLSPLRLIFTVILQAFCISSEEIYLELSPFAVKPMFWFSIWTNQITANYISSSGCGPDCWLQQIFLWWQANNCATQALLNWQNSCYKTAEKMNQKSHR